MATSATESSSEKSGVRPNPLLAAAPPKPRRRWWPWLLAIAAIAGGGAYFSGILKPHGQAQATVATTASAAAPEPVVVTTVLVTARPMQRTVPIVGTFYGIDEVAISPKVDGRIVKIKKDLGDTVKPGDVLMEIEDTDYRLAVDEAKRGLDLELAKLGLKALPDDKFDVRQLPSVVKTDSMEKNMAQKRERVRTLGRAGTQEDADQVEADYQIAKANRDQAILEAQTTLASVRWKQSILAMAEQKLAETKVRVPEPSPDRLAEIRTARGNGAEAITYVVAQRLVSEGEMVRTMATSPVYRLVLDCPLKLQGTVPERYSAEVKIGQPVAITVESYPGEKFAGQVARANPTVDRISRTFQVEVLVPNLDRRLRAGSFAKAEIQTKQDPGAITVPEEAIITFAGVAKVFVIRDGKAAPVPVEVGPRIELQSQAGKRQSWLEVRGNLKAGEPAITSGQTQLAEGTAVRPR